MRSLVGAVPLLGLVLVSTGCDDVIFGESEPEVEIEAEGFEGAREAIEAAACFGCHSPSGGGLFGLDLETDLYGATVGVVGGYAIPIVLPGDPDNSMLYLKLIDAQPDGTGTAMPPGTAGVSSALSNPVLEWIRDCAPDAAGNPAEGCTTDADEP